jgi:hypothetical protein
LARGTVSTLVGKAYVAYMLGFPARGTSLVGECLLRIILFYPLSFLPPNQLISIFVLYI